MFLKILVLVSAITQVVAPAYLSIGTFETSERIMQVFIQPAGWAFSIWGLIYTLSFIYAIYQLIPKYENELLKKTRVPAIVGFLGSVSWLYFAGLDNIFVWLTIPILFLMAISFTFVIRAKDDENSLNTLLSKKILFPYAAWTGIASWLNIQSLLSEKTLISTDLINLLSNGILFFCIATFTLYYFRKTNYSFWYGGVMIWAGIGVIFSNLNGGSILFAILGGLLIVTTLIIYIKNYLKK
jgi:hypothetical protein